MDLSVLLIGTISVLATLVATVVASLLAVLTLYLLILTCAAVLARQSAPPPGPARRRFAILVPAHDEQLVIGRLLRSLQTLDYPRQHYEVCVVADNCGDATAQIARDLGARVYERATVDERAKGFALRWLLEQLRLEQREYDAFVVLDADSAVAPELLRVMDARLEAGSQVIQAYYSVLNAQDSAVAGLRFAALAAVHYLRPLGRSALGLSCGLKGNGMCFTARVMERFAWRWYTLAEDVEFHLALVGAGVRVDFAWETTVLADMPVSFAQARSQNARWEGGRLQLLRGEVGRLIVRGIRRGSALQLDAAFEQLIPPLSVPFALGTVCVIGSLIVGAHVPAGLAAASVVGQMTYLATGLALVRAPRRAYLAFSSAPIYIAWKFGLYAQTLLSTRASAWIRTARVPD